MPPDDKLKIISLSPKEYHLFLQFQKRIIFMTMLETAGAFAIRNGSLEAHFDSKGDIVKIDVHQHYRP